MYKAFATDCNGFALSFQQAASTLAKLGCEGFWFNIQRDSGLGATDTRALMEETNLRPAGFGLPVEFRKDEGTFLSDMEKLDGYLAFARDVGLTRTMTWIVPSSDTLDYADNFQLHRNRLSKIARRLGDYGVGLGLEFVGPPSKRKGRRYEFVHTLDGALALRDAIGFNNVGLVLDAWHWYMAGQTKADYEKIRDEREVVLVHINDAPTGIPVAEQLDNARALPGSTGILPVGELFDALIRLGYTGPVVAEPFVWELSKIPFAKAAKILMDSMDSVWPKEGNA